MYYRGIEAEYNVLALLDDPVAQNCTRISFVSTSNGRGRPLRSPREVNFVRHNGKNYTLSENSGRLDEIADELLGETVRPEFRRHAFIQKVFQLPDNIRSVRRKQFQKPLLRKEKPSTVESVISGILQRRAT